MAIEPNTVVKLYENIPWSRDKLDFRYFKTFDERNEYFNTTKQAKWTLTNFKYLRHEEGHPIAIPIGTSGYDAQSGDTIPTTYSQVLHCNYVFYQNSNYKERWFGGFITDVKYINDGTVWVYFDEDIYQNWFPYITIDSGFIERETVDDDTIGKHVLPESVGSDNYVTMTKNIHYNWNTTVGSPTLCPIIISSEPPKSSVSLGVKAVGGIAYVSEPSEWFVEVTCPSIQNGFPVNMFMTICKEPANYWLNQVADLDVVNPATSTKFSQATVTAAFNYLASTTQGVIGIYLVPKAMLKYTPTPFADITSKEKYSPYSNVGHFSENIQVDAPVCSITPKNNKLYTYPFTKLLLTCGGRAQELKYEDLSGRLIQIEFSMSPTPAICCTPLHYAYGSGFGRQTLYQLIYDDFPTLGWNEDSYSRWLAANQGTIARTVITTAVGATLLAAGMPGGLGLALGTQTLSKHAGFNTPKHLTRRDSINANRDQYFYDNQESALSLAGGAMNLAGSALNAYCAPDNVNGVVRQSAPNIINSDISVITYCQSIKSAPAQAIDNYFSMFGYKVNRVGKPNLTSRKNWNYVKTQNAHCSGVVPQYAIEFMERALDTGCTFWHKNAVGDYGDLSNPIV